MKYRTFDRMIIVKSAEFAREKMKSLRSSHGWDHVQRVMMLAEKISAREKADPFIVEVAAALHDIARVEEERSGGKICHAARGAVIAGKFLGSLGLDPERTARVVHCVASHRYRNSIKPETIEAKALFDADKLDSIGAIGIGRAFLFSGEVGARLHNPDIDVRSTRAYSEEDTAYREYIVKLRHLRKGMLTGEGRRLAKGRHDFMKGFFTQLQAETKGRR
jgi:uncharacterized protein